MTTTGEATFKAVAWPDAAGDISLGVVGCAPGHDINTAYATGDMVPVYMTGSGAVVWVRYRTSAGALTAGAIISGGGATIDGLAIAGVDNATLWNYLGRVTHWHDDIAAEAWIKVRLAI